MTDAVAEGARVVEVNYTIAMVEVGALFDPTQSPLRIFVASSPH
jgi:hypothetical protein